MKKDFNVIIEKDEDGFYIASVPALKGCHTQAKSLDVLMERIKEAIELCLEDQNKPIYPTDFIGVQKITVNENVIDYKTPLKGKSIKTRIIHRSSKNTWTVKNPTTNPKVSKKN